MKIVLLPSETATVLVEALPYIRQFAGKSVVVKLGGAAIDKSPTWRLPRMCCSCAASASAACSSTAAGPRSTPCFAASARSRSSRTGFA